MKLFKILAIAAMAMVSSVSAQAGVVLSNMGATGTDNTSTNTNTDIVANDRIAAGFTTGSTDQILDWVALWTFNNDSDITRTVSIFSDAAGSPGTVFGTSTATTVPGTKGRYQFDFSGVTLAANTKYWVLPAVDLAWYTVQGGAAPTAQNGSGFSFDGMKETFNGGTSWNPLATNYTLAISTSDVPPAAIPEPALTSLLCLSGIALIRRRMKK
jgi:hypothetical protein